MQSSTLRKFSIHVSEDSHRSKKVKVEARCIISPFSRFFVIWTLLQQFVLVGWHFIFWIRVAFGPHDREISGLRPFELFLDALLFLDLVLKFFTGVTFSNTKKNLEMRDDDEIKEYEYIFKKRKIALYYIKTTFFIDFISLVPFFLYQPITEFGEENLNWQRVYYLKVIRLFFSSSINQSIDTIFKQIGIKDQSYSLKHKNRILVMAIYMKFSLQIHCLTCIWIFLGRQRSGDLLAYLNVDTQNYSTSEGWITRNLDKYGEMSHTEKYVYAMSLITETISKVGYGQEHAPLSASEKIFLIMAIMVNSNLLVMIFFQIN